MSMKRLIASVGIAAGLITTGAVAPTTPTADAAGTWGAIAWAYNGRAAGGYGSSTPGPAIREAKRRCGPQCGYFTFHDSCGAIAYQFSYGYNERRTRIARVWGYPSHRSARQAARNRLGWVTRVNSVCSWG
ncbi:DUF4189 domain-containing protein [Gordonia crocea]|uniref:DUF4189 domain-containing protein n=1 Tax=Gordonia crocea TaxID=589162 RepID=A0A7M3SUN3_9ACTN|nr:DUF4189 domain-containing protein [Gordonia crocea]GED96357.1 hypothetical protein nbrc107697_03960 [Gordonia crocea]